VLVFLISWDTKNYLDTNLYVLNLFRYGIPYFTDILSRTAYTIGGTFWLPVVSTGDLRANFLFPNRSTALTYILDDGLFIRVLCLAFLVGVGRGCFVRDVGL
jgi:hypothetical protein